ncbi:MAG TPA: DUF881 domain-containing protein [Acidothermaceae bacterium]|jgi:uncharacterized protein YlxW (UPF0749 family)|nr:DUF881 domain-containing protein [Acidothermaceae bacterium]
MSILLDLMGSAIDEGYAEAANRKGIHPPTNPTAVSKPSAAPKPATSNRWVPTRTTIAAAVVLAMAGALFATAAVATHRGNAAAHRDQSQLVQQAKLQTTATDSLQQQLTALKTQVDAARSRALSVTDKGGVLLTQIKDLEPVDGAVAVDGTGVRVVLDDAPASNVAGNDGSGVILDSDLQQVVNALFVGGAQAIGINGQRLTTQTAIREAGGAILVDYRALSPPYTIDAIGPSTLGATFQSSETAQLFVTEHQLYGLGFTVADHQRLTLPSAANVVVHYAQPLDSQ